MTGRSTSRRDKHRRTIAKDRPPCALCHEDIDWTADHLHPLSYTIDHVIPIAKGGPDELFLPDGTPQIVAAHRKCNRAKGDGGPNIKAAVAFVTERAW